MTQVGSWHGATFRLGVWVALLTAVADQAVKFWLLYGFDLPGLDPDCRNHVIDCCREHLALAPTLSPYPWYIGP